MYFLTASPSMCMNAQPEWEENGSFRDGLILKIPFPAMLLVVILGKCSDSLKQLSSLCKNDAISSCRGRSSYKSQDVINQSAGSAMAYGRDVLTSEAR